MSMRLTRDLARLERRIAALEAKLGVQNLSPAQERSRDEAIVANGGPQFRAKHKGFGNWFVIDVLTGNNVSGPFESREVAEQQADEQNQAVAA